MCKILMYSEFKLRARLTCTPVRLMSIVLNTRAILRSPVSSKFSLYCTVLKLNQCFICIFTRRLDVPTAS